MVQLGQHAQQGPDRCRLIVEKVRLRLAKAIRKSQTVEVLIEPLKYPRALILRHLLADLAFLVHSRVGLVSVRLQLPSIVDSERSNFKLHLRLALERVTPLLCPVLSADAHG